MNPKTGSERSKLITLMLRRVVTWAWIPGLLFACGSAEEMCSNQVLASLKSPDEQHEARVFLRDCGLVVGVSTHVAIGTPAAPIPDASGNCFAAESLVAVSLAWRSADELTISIPQDAEIRFANAETESVRVSVERE